MTLDTIGQGELVFSVACLPVAQPRQRHRIIGGKK